MLSFSKVRDNIDAKAAEQSLQLQIENSTISLLLKKPLNFEAKEYFRLVVTLLGTVKETNIKTGATRILKVSV